MEPVQPDPRFDVERLLDDRDLGLLWIPLAREYGIPAVVGCGDTTARLRTGMRVTVDGTTDVERDSPA